MSLELPEQLLREGREVLAIPIGVSRNEFVITKFTNLRRTPGWRVKDGEVLEWFIEGFFKQGDRLYLYGSYAPGRFLEQVIQEDPRQALPALARMAQALALLRSRGLGIDRLQTDTVCFLQTGELLFLPPEVMRQAVQMQPADHKFRVFELINHPDFKDAERRLSFSLAALLFRVIAGEYPFQADTDEELHNRIRYQKLPPLDLSFPGLKPEAAETILTGLGRSEGKLPSLERWAQLLSDWAQQGLFVPLSEEQARALREKAAAQREKALQSYRRQVFWQKHWKTVAICVAAAVVVGILAGTFLKNLLAPRATRGFTPRQVVETFYLSANRLDHTLMEDCVVEKAGKQMIGEAMNLYVLSRVSLGYEGKSNIVPADEWVRQGKPPLIRPVTVYGVTDLKIQAERGEPEPVFTVHYLKWLPRSGPERQELDSQNSGLGQPYGPDEVPYETQSIAERVYLRKDRGDWVIYRIEPL